MQQVLITGAAGGIGRAAAKKFSAQGNSLWLVDRDGSALEELSRELPQCRASIVDLADRAQLSNLLSEIENYSGELAVGLVNAGIASTLFVADSDPADLDLQLEVNLRSAIQINRALAKKMLTQKHGHIINTISAAALVPLPGSATYSATKFGLRGFTNALHAELHGSGVYVSGIYPSAVDTPMLRWEVRNGGSPLNFVSTPKSADYIAELILKALRTRKLEYYSSRSDSWMGKLIGCVPGLLVRIYPFFARLGQRGMQRYRRQVELQGEH